MKKFRFNFFTNEQYITDTQNAYNYIVKNSYIVRPSKGGVIHDDKDKTQLTLITCFQQGYYRTVISAELDSITPYTK